MANRWLVHVKAVKAKNAGLMKTGGLKAILKLAGKTYKKDGKSVKKTKSKKGGKSLSKKKVNHKKTRKVKKGSRKN